MKKVIVLFIGAVLIFGIFSLFSFLSGPIHFLVSILTEMFIGGFLLAAVFATILWMRKKM